MTRGSQSPVLLWNSTLCCVVTHWCAQAVLRGKSWHHGFGPDAKARREGRRQMLSKSINSGHFKDYIQEHKTSKKQGRDRKVSPFTPSWLRVIWLCCVSRSSLHSTPHSAFRCPTQTNFWAILPVSASVLLISQLHLDTLNHETLQCTDH